MSTQAVDTNTVLNRALELWNDAKAFAYDREPYPEARCENCGNDFIDHDGLICPESRNRQFESFTVDYMNEQRVLTGQTARMLEQAWSVMQHVPISAVVNADTHNWNEAFNTLNDYFMEWELSPELEAAYLWLDKVANRIQPEQRAA